YSIPQKKVSTRETTADGTETITISHSGVAPKCCKTTSHTPMTLWNIPLTIFFPNPNIQTTAWKRFHVSNESASIPEWHRAPRSRGQMNQRDAHQVIHAAR